jgi:hypothetical protein
LDNTTYIVGSVSAATNARFLTEKDLEILLGWRLSQPRISSNAISHTKNSWKVLPFHMSSNEPASSRYSHKSGTANASNGTNFNSVSSCSLRNDRILCILYATKPGLPMIITVHLGFKNNTHSAVRACYERAEPDSGIGCSVIFGRKQPNNMQFSIYKGAIDCTKRYSGDVYSSTIFASRFTVSSSAMVDFPVKYPQTSPGFTTKVFPFLRDTLA